MTRALVSLTLTTAAAMALVVPAAAPPSFPAHVARADHAKVAEAVAIQKKGGAPPTELIPMDDDLGIRVNVGRKATGAAAEVHATYGHVFFVQEGSGTVVLGGSLVNGKENRPGEWTAPSTTGGQEFKMAKGDMITVQAGMPHWWKEVAPEGIVFIAFHAYPERNRLKP